MNRMFNKVTVYGAVATLAVVLITSQAALAKSGKKRGPNPEHRLEFLTIVLDLTEEQQKAIQPILESEAEEIRAVRDKHSDEGREARKQGRGEIREIREKYSKLIQAELSEEQAEKYKKLEELRHKKRGRGPGPKK